MKTTKIYNEYKELLYKNWSEKHANFTHLSMGDRFRGTFRFEDPMDFMRYYSANLANNNFLSQPCILETKIVTTPILIDIDIKVKNTNENWKKKTLYSIGEIKAIIKIWIETLKEIFPDITKENLYACLFEKGMYITESGEISNGYHIHFPRAIINREFLKSKIIPLIKEKMSSIEIIGNIDYNIYNLNWLLYGSSKKEVYEPYHLSCIFNEDLEEISEKQCFQGLINKNIFYQYYLWKYNCHPNYKKMEEYNKRKNNLDYSDIFLKPFIFSIKNFTEQEELCSTYIKGWNAEIHNIKFDSKYNRKYNRKNTDSDSDSDSESQDENINENNYRQRLKDLLQILPDNISEFYDEWKNVCSCISQIFNRDDQGLKLFHSFSKKSHKYDPDKVNKKYEGIDHFMKKIQGIRLLEGYIRDNINNKDECKKYKFYRRKYYNLSSTKKENYYANLTDKEREIHDKKLMKKSGVKKYVIIPDEIYNENRMRNITREFLFEKSTICIIANTGLGKTKSIDSILKDTTLNICIVNFRNSINYEYMKKYEDFKFYQNLLDKNGYIDMDKHSRVITTIHSFWKIYGRIDVLILDESESIYKTLINSIEESSLVYNTLQSYIQNPNTKIIAMDATMGEKTLEFLKERKPFIIRNKYKPHTDRVAYFYDEEKYWLDMLETKIQEKKKIVLCCGLKTHPESIVDALIENKELELDEKRVLKLDANTIKNHRDCNEWKNYDLVMYSPCIQAGVSFEDNYFDTVFCLFSRRTGDSEDALQSANRVRNIKDKEYHIFVQGKDRRYIDYSPEIAFNTKKMEKIIDSTDLNTFSFLEWKLDSKFIHPPTKKLIKNSYYHLHVNVLVSNNINKAFMKRMVMNRFKKQGVVCKEIKRENSPFPIKEKSKEFYEKRTEAISLAKTRINDKEIQKIIDAEPLDEKEIGHYKTKPKTEEDIYRLKKYRLKSKYKVKDEEITRNFIIKYRDLIYCYKTLTKFCNFCKLEKNSIESEQDNFPLKIPKNLLSEIKIIKKNLENPVKFITKKKYDGSMNTAERLKIKKYHERHLELIRILEILGFNQFFPDENGKNNLDKRNVKYDEMIRYMIDNKKKHNSIGVFPTKIIWNKLKNKNDKIRIIHKFLNIHLYKDFGVKIETLKNKTFLSGITDYWDFNREKYTIKPLLNFE